MKDSGKNKIKIKATLNKRKPQLFPKFNQTYESGEYAILCFDVKEVIEGEPIINQYGNVVVKGYMPYIEDHKKIYNITAEESESKGEMQYTALFVGEDIDLSSPEAQRVFLETILTDTQVDELYKTYENPIVYIEQGDIESLTKVKGIGKPTAEKIIKKYEENKDYSTSIVELANFGLTLHMIKKLTDYYGSPLTLVEKIKNDPYILADEVDGIGFKKADGIALSNGESENSTKRLRAYIKHILSEAGESGYSWISSSVLVDRIESELYEFQIETIIDVVEKMKKDGILLDGEKGKVALKYYYELEEQIATELFRLKNSQGDFDFEGWEDRVKVAEKLQGWEFTEEQIEAIKMIMSKQVCVLTGKGGVGKSSTVLGAIKALGNVYFAQCALSGKASARLKEVTGYEAHTIHRLLGFDPNSFKENKSMFIHNRENQLSQKVVILDEFSMVGGSLFLSLIESIPSGSKFIMIGDKGQLPSIGSLNLASDITDSPTIPTAYLTKIHRQATKSAVIVDSIKISEGEQIVDSSFDGVDIRGELQDLELDIHNNKELTTKKIVKHFKEKLALSGNDIMEVQVIVPMNTRGESSVFELNPLLQNIYNPYSPNKREIQVSFGKKYTSTFRVGDKLINVKNNYKLKEYKNERLDLSWYEELEETYEPPNIPVFNGFMGELRDIKGTDLIVYFPLLEKEIIIPKGHWQGDNGVMLGYASTCHKSQGSGFKYPICAVDYSHFMMLTREWVYTAITRTTKHCTLIAENKALKYAINQSAIEEKQTFLPILLDRLSK